MLEVLEVLEDDVDEDDEEEESDDPDEVLESDDFAAGSALVVSPAWSHSVQRYW